MAHSEKHVPLMNLKTKLIYTSNEHKKNKTHTTNELKTKLTAQMNLKTKLTPLMNLKPDSQH